MTARCPRCDREECHRVNNLPDLLCAYHRVDWRARCLAAEAERDALRAEVDRLKAEVARVRAVAEEAIDGWESQQAMPDSATERLRAAIAAEVNEIAGSLRKKEADHA